MISKRRRRAGSPEPRSGPAQRAHGVDLFLHFHRSDRRGEGRPGPARNNDGCQQNAQLAQHRDRDQLDHENLGPELFQLSGPLKGQHNADQKTHQGNNRDGPKTRPPPSEIPALPVAAAMASIMVRANRCRVRPRKPSIERVSFQAPGRAYDQRWRPNQQNCGVPLRYRDRQVCSWLQCLKQGGLSRA